ncbi:hypothetical protein A3F02_03250 [Candidatus Curtissbacteria bacterium RIFCSPHIGHO2_12_FULL_38_9b]|uniref:PIN domain-containing protein n=2 Tax=Candidatus Curtissiibacteriota TaxID=1752717 RepID=A0A1F5GXQ8_9BACT|nr:MAG: hypothetical protein A3A48_02415 [Candidatus Curtissbacteria bacterium RIFCSPLOWO2_01_FULL_37_9]OGD96599.1 MAG: hypothetical protein A3F02_03250 [Candidatus Curtissbacteria bacterium RIFCSPHIGHO2_12_FULL_38_9b]
MIFVDTNYFLRFLLKDNKLQHRKAKQLMLDSAQGKLKLFTSIIVFFEIYWVLSSYYGRNKTELIKALKDVINLTFIEIEERPIITNALEVFAQNNISLEDSFNLSYAASHQSEDFKTFDLKLGKLFKK